MLILAIRSQNVLFAMNLDDEIKICERDFEDVFITRSAEKHNQTSEVRS